MNYDKHKYIGLLGLLFLVGLKGFFTDNYLWFLFFINYGWFTFFYERSIVYKLKK
ncbi:MAG: hypothetical protein PUE01_13455 [Clostridiaceae bacterium]|nr:hypothetical protein [Clostridiaceae bacterium]